MVPEPKPDACETARELLSKFVHAGLKRSEGRVFRTHLTRCPACRALYKESLVSAAQIGRAMRETRVERERVVRHERLRASALKAGERIKHGRRFGLRLMLLPAAVIVLLLMGPRMSRGEPMILRWDGGEVRAAGMRLTADRPDLVLETGDWCATNGNAHASIEGENRSFELGLLTQVMVENTREGRLRLQQGELQASGSVTISSAFGVLEMEDGSAVLRIEGGKFRVECRAGKLTWTDPGGRRSLSAGERL